MGDDLFGSDESFTVRLIGRHTLDVISKNPKVLAIRHEFLSLIVFDAMSCRQDLARADF